MAKILVVEDDRSMNEILTKTLLEEGHQVESTLNAKLGVQMAESHTFDLIITDVRLPGMDGVEGVAHIKSIQPGIRCIVITGYASAEVPVRAIRLKVDDYLIKPFRLRNFLYSIDMVLDTEKRFEVKARWIEKLYPGSTRERGPELKRLMETRMQAIRALFIGTRSGLLTRHAASEVYIRIEILEKKYRKVLQMMIDPERQFRMVRVQYAAILDRLAAFHSGTADDPDDSFVLPAGQFTGLYEAIKRSDVGLDDLQFAPLMRRASAEQLQEYPELLDIRARLWPSLV